MAQRRMFSLKIVASDAFLEMPVSSQTLYFHLGMYADDDGFVNPKRIMRIVGVSDDDLKVLLAKRFILPFENGVVVIKHWLINNLVRKDFYQETIYLEQKRLLKVKENKSYTEVSKQNVNILDTQVRLGKVRLGNKKVVEQVDNNIINSLVRNYYDIVKEKKGYGIKTTAQDIKNLKSFLKDSSEIEIKAIFDWYVKTDKFKEFPNLSTAISAHSVNLYRSNKNNTW